MQQFGVVSQAGTLIIQNIFTKLHMPYFFKTVLQIKRNGREETKNNKLLHKEQKNIKRVPWHFIAHNFRTWILDKDEAALTHGLVFTANLISFRSARSD